MMEKLEDLEDRLGHRFADAGLLEIALTHRSAAHQRGVPSYERLEFLGDSVIGLVTARWLFETFPQAAEGELARRKSYLVSAPVLARLAHRLGLGELLRLGPGEERSGGRGKRSLLADSAESVIGALFQDAGLTAVATILEPFLAEVHRAHPELENQDAKTKLQELLQAVGIDPPRYRVGAESGPDHDRRFEISCLAGDRELGAGSGRSKKAAEQEAARVALERLGDDGSRLLSLVGR